MHTYADLLCNAKQVIRNEPSVVIMQQVTLNNALDYQANRLMDY